MTEITESTRDRTIGVAALLVAVVGGVAFWEWRKRAPLAQLYRRAKRRRGEERADQRPNPEREPGTDPV